jgi:hypothetical protein
MLNMKLKMIIKFVIYNCQPNEIIFELIKQIDI